MNRFKLSMAVLAALIMANMYNAKAQDVFEFRPTVNVGYSITGSYMVVANSSLNSKMYEYNSGGSIVVDADLFEIFPRLSGGFHLGFGLMGYTNSSMEYTDAEVKNTLGVHYGFDLHYSVFSSKYWNIQVGASMGSIASKACIPIAEYGLTSTVKFFPIEKLGLFIETGWGNYIFSKKNFDELGAGNANLKFGVSYRF